MRSILLAVVLAASTLVTSMKIAHACGGSYEWQPTALAVASPHMRPGESQSFVLLWDQLDAKRTAAMTWTRLNTTSFDSTQIAAGRRLEQPVRLTLLGPSGTKTVELRDTVWIDLAFDHQEPREAVAIAKSDAVIALEGHHEKATWESFRVIHGSTVTSFLAKGLHITVAHGGDRTFVVGNNTITGQPLGIATINGTRYLAVRSTTGRRDTRLVKLPAGAAI